MQVDGMLEVFTCPICLEYASEAVSTSCCQQVYCHTCLTSLPHPSYCPSCRSNNKKVTFVEAVAIRRALEQLPTTCPYKCGVTGLKRDGIKSHISNYCPKRLLRCPCPTCTVAQMPADSLPEHIAKVHGAQLIANGARLFQEIPTSPIPRALPASSPSPSPSPSPSTASDKRVERIHNANGRQTRLGTDGMRYCGGALPQPACRCCDGRCGPTNGCACVACMVLELNLRKLPLGWLINKNGAACRKGATGHFYCGRKAETALPGSDGWCGPTDGPQCEYCMRIELQANSWYSSVDSLRGPP